MFYANFDIEKLAIKMGIQIFEKKLSDDVAGFFVMSHDIPVITYKSDPLNDSRTRFTIAHEIGHYILHSKDQLIFIDKSPKVMYRNTASSSGEILKEREANAFAAALLMPKDLLIAEINEAPNYIDEAIKHLSDTFGVSQQAMTFRLSNIGYDIG
jgi:Zn-dependent peptidase ImmA (M78 family)